MISCGNIVYVFQNNWRENTDDLQDIVTAELNAKVWSDNCDKYRIQSASMLTVLSMFLIGSFLTLLYILNKMLSENLTSYRKTIVKLFVLFTISYVLRTPYTWFFGMYYHLVCSQFTRDVTILFLNLIWDILPIMSILIMHHLNFRTFDIPITEVKRQKDTMGKSSGDQTDHVCYYTGKETMSEGD